MGTSVVSWMILHRTQQHLKQPGGCSERSQLDSAPQETSGDGQSEQRDLHPPLPALHLISPVEQGVAERTAAVPCPWGISDQEAPQRCPLWELGRSGLCRMGSPGLWFISAHRCSDISLEPPSLPCIRCGAVDITQADCAENFQTLLSSSWTGTKMSKKMMNSSKRSTNCSLPMCKQAARLS